MAENFDNTEVASSTVTVKADLDGFKRDIDQALAELDAKLGEAATKGGDALVRAVAESMSTLRQQFEGVADDVAKAFTEKVGGAMDVLAERLAVLAEKASNIKVEVPTQQAQQQGGRDDRQDDAMLGEVRALTAQVEDISGQLKGIAESVTVIQAGVGNR